MTPADLVLHRGPVITVDAMQSVHEAVAVRGERIVAVGTEADLQPLIGDHTSVVDLDGRSVIPGIVDAHLHLAHWALTRPPLAVNLGPDAVRDVAGLRAAVAAARDAPRPTDWIIGNGWSEGSIGEFHSGATRPHRDLLDDVTGTVPTILRHRSLHAALVNTAALVALGIDDATLDPSGGEIVRDPATGAATGVLSEAAAFMAEPPEISDAAWSDAVVAAAEELVRRGVTSITDPMVPPHLLRNYVRLHQTGRLPLRLGVLLHWTPPGPENRTERLVEALRNVGVTNGIGDDWFRLEGVKLFADGIPPLRTSWMSAPMCGGGCGTLVTAGNDDQERLHELTSMISLLHRHRCQIGVHATGDRASASVAEAFMASFDADPWPDGRHHLIHASLLAPEVARALSAYPVSISSNSLIKWGATAALSSVFDEATNAYHVPIKSLIEAGLHVADASDAPISEPEWPRALQTLVRRDVRGWDRPSGPDEAVDRQTALRCLTLEGAWQQGLEHERGSIEVGKLADLVVLDDDLLAVPDDRLHRLRATTTVVGGRTHGDRDSA